MMVRSKLILLTVVLVAANAVFSLLLILHLGGTSTHNRWADWLSQSADVAAELTSDWLAETILDARIIQEGLIDELASAEDLTADSLDQLSEEIQRVAAKSDRFRLISVVDTDSGEVLASSDKSEVGKIRHDIRSAEYLPDTSVSGVKRNLIGGLPFIRAIVPFVESEDSSRAVLEMYYYLGELADILEAQQFGESGVVFATDRFGLVLTRPDRNDPKTFMAKRLVSTAVLDCIAGNSGDREVVDYRGIAVIESYRWSEKAQVCILAKIDRSEAFRDVWWLIESIASVSLLFLGIIILLAWLLAGQLTAGLEKLRETAHRFASGDYSSRLNVVTDDEVGRVARVFNAMADRVSLSQAELKHMVKERTKELERALQDLKEVDKLKDDFLNVTSHELKTPLIPIKAQAQMLLRGTFGKLNEKQTKAIRMIHRKEEEMKRLVSDVLDIAKLKSGEMAMDFEPIAVNGIVEEAVEGFRQVAEDKPIELALDLPTESLVIEADGGRLGQVFRNLLDNALKFTSAKGRVAVSLKAEGDKVKVQVSDTGIGMTEDTISRLFTPFFQANMDIRRQFGGTGLGLAICKQIVERHGGTIEAFSDGLDKGARFEVKLPKSSLTPSA